MTPVQETPQIFTVITVLVVLASAITFLAVVYRILRGRRGAATGLFSRWCVAAAIYLVTSLAVSAFRPRHIVAMGQDWCFDDLCFAVDDVVRAEQTDGHALLTMRLRIHNAARSPEAARGFWAYLRDEHDTRYQPRPGPWQDVISTPVPPHGFMRTAMSFDVPGHPREFGFVTGHGGVSTSTCALFPSVLEIGQGTCLFGRPDMIRIR
jgi:hypothetical protein